MKVLQILYSGLGGHGNVATSLVRADTARRWEHRLLFYGVEDLLPDYAAFCARRRIPYTFVRKPRGALRVGAAALAGALRRHRPDAVVLHTPVLAPFVKAYCLLGGARLLVVEHTPNAAKTRAEWLASFLAPLLADRVVYLTPAYRQELRARPWLAWTVDRAAVIPNGLDLDAFAPPAPGSERRVAARYHLGMVGRFSAQKDQALVVDALAALARDRGLDKDVVVHFAGCGDTLEAVRRRVAARGLQARVVFHGVLGEAALIALLRGLDVYVHASHAETMCTSVMQAMACGLPVVASRIPGIRELVVDRETAWLVDPGDAAGLAAGLEDLLRDGARRAALGRAARAHAVRQFAAARAFRRYHEVLTEGPEPGRAPRPDPDPAAP
jgi:glycosyltransferase involved in cell wall biosynthesis